MVLLKRRYIMQYQPLYFLSNGTGTYIQTQLSWFYLCTFSWLCGGSLWQYGGKVRVHIDIYKPVLTYTKYEILLVIIRKYSFCYIKELLHQCLAFFIIFGFFNFVWSKWSVIQNLLRSLNTEIVTFSFLLSIYSYWNANEAIVTKNF